MSDLISRAEAIAIATQEGAYGYISAQELAEMPSAERKGHWIRTGEDGYCSECKCDMPMFREDWDLKFCETDFCPCCGADMRGEEE